MISPACITPSFTLMPPRQKISSIIDCDRIVVLDDGAAAGVGTHQELLESCQVYRDIYQSQYGKEALSEHTAFQKEAMANG